MFQSFNIKKVQKKHAFFTFIQRKYMKTSNKILLGVAAVAVAGLVVYAANRKKTHRMLEQIADEGYETAHDVLFPDNEKRNKKLQYGPVLPA